MYPSSGQAHGSQNGERRNHGVSIALICALTITSTTVLIGSIRAHMLSAGPSLQAVPNAAWPDKTSKPKSAVSVPETEHSAADPPRLLAPAAIEAEVESNPDFILEVWARWKSLLESDPAAAETLEWILATSPLSAARKLSDSAESGLRAPNPRARNLSVVILGRLMDAASANALTTQFPAELDPEVRTTYLKAFANIAEMGPVAGLLEGCASGQNRPESREAVRALAVGGEPERAAEFIWKLYCGAGSAEKSLHILNLGQLLRRGSSGARDHLVSIARSMETNQLRRLSFEQMKRSGTLSEFSATELAELESLK